MLRNILKKFSQNVGTMHLRMTSQYYNPPMHCKHLRRNSISMGDVIVSPVFCIKQEHMRKGYLDCTQWDFVTCGVVSNDFTHYNNIREKSLRHTWKSFCDLALLTRTWLPKITYVTTLLDSLQGNCMRSAYESNPKQVYGDYPLTSLPFSQRSCVKRIVTG